MDLTFDIAKNEANLAKHGVTIAAAEAVEVRAVVADDRFAGEQRNRPYGMLDGVPHCLAAVLRDRVVRAISFRRSRAKEYRRHVQ